MKTLETWCGSRVPVDQMPRVLMGWRSYAKRLERQLTRMRKPKTKFGSLEYQLTEVLSRYCGERIGNGTEACGEGAVETLERIVWERDQALKILALDRLRKG